MKKRLEVGDVCFWSGEGYIIAGCTCPHDWLLFKPEMGQNHAFSVNRSAVQALVTDVFAIGDRVRSKVTFRGQVIGFDLVNNEAICVSDRLSDYDDRHGKGTGQRIRWSYKVHELVAIEEFKFEIGQVYQVRGNGHACHITAKAMQDPHSTGKVILYTENGRVLSIVPQIVEHKDLPNFGICAVEVI